MKTKESILKKHMTGLETVEVATGFILSAMEEYASQFQSGEQKILVSDEYEKLKRKVVAVYVKIGDKKALISKGRSYTGTEIADEISRDTDFGISMIKNLMSLTIDLVSRDKLSNKTTQQQEEAVNFLLWKDKHFLQSVTKDCYFVKSDYLHLWPSLGQSDTHAKRLYAIFKASTTLNKEE